MSRRYGITYTLLAVLLAAVDCSSLVTLCIYLTNSKCKKKPTSQITVSVEFKSQDKFWEHWTRLLHGINMKRPLEVINVHKRIREAQPTHPEVCNEFNCNLALLSARRRELRQRIKIREQRMLCSEVWQRSKYFMLKEQRMYVPCPLDLHERDAMQVFLTVLYFHPAYSLM